MNALEPFAELFDATVGDELRLPAELRRLYHHLRIPPHGARPYVFANVVTTLDGVVSLGIPGQAGGGEISGFNPHDRMLMGLLRAIADAVVVGGGTVREASDAHLWTADYIYPPLTRSFHELRAAMGKPGPPLNVIVTARGEIDIGRRLFQSGEAPSLIVTTAAGARRLGERGLPPAVHVAIGAQTAPLSMRAVLDALCDVRPCSLVLIEAGPRVMGTIFAEALLDELFLTIAPQVAGRDDALARPGLVAGQRLASEHPIWGRLVNVRQAGDHLFLRYAFPS